MKAVGGLVDMSAASIEERLQEASRLSPLNFEPLPRVSMAPEAVEERLRECAEMSRLCWELATPAETERPRHPAP